MFIKGCLLRSVFWSGASTYILFLCSTVFIFQIFEMFLRCCWPPGWFLRICLVDTRSFWILILCLLTRFWLEPSITFFVLAPMIVLSKYFNSVSYFIRLSTRYRFIIMSSGFIHGIVLVPFLDLIFMVTI